MPLVVCKLGHVVEVGVEEVVPSGVGSCLASARMASVSVLRLPTDSAIAPAVVVLRHNVVCPSPLSSPICCRPRLDVEVV